MKYQDLVKTALKTKKLLADFEQKNHGKKWGNEELLLGLVTDIGDLARLILAKEGFRSVNQNLNHALRHEFADCFWSIIVLATQYKIDLPQALEEMSKEIEINTKSSP
jgi:NTP pyrophosphatase (non-canonical NTP hydrolase)